jgi:hypothetical protein
MIGRSMTTRRPSYRPVVFFRHLRLFVRSIPQEKNWLAIKLLFKKLR